MLRVQLVGEEQQNVLFATVQRVLVCTGLYHHQGCVTKYGCVIDGCTVYYI